MADTNSIFVKENIGRSGSYSGSSLNIVLPKAYEQALNAVISTRANVATAQKSGAVSIRGALSAIDRQRSLIQEKNLQEKQSSISVEEKQLDDQFASESVSYKEYKGVIQKYSGSDEQLDTYKQIFENDLMFKKHILQTYGSVENYNLQKNFKLKSSIFNPLYDYSVDVSIVTSENNYYKADHISVDEIIMESLSGICTYYYIKVDNSAGKSTGTLSGGYIPASQLENRSRMFSPIMSRSMGPRVIIWDILKQRWNSFYMKNLIRFIRDETRDIE